ncbi:hypothetical protein [Spiroplasma endosymbiont of Polydrusus pterygomalis]|uniref:hypothetical protein n=1 Tax=Spiroplasma endosymbiont of Polydrusus pterygomalis TaxID=3139327 RepID=UPI003CCAB30D
MNKHLIFLHTIIPLTFLGNTVNTSFHKTINHENTILINETTKNNASFNNQFNYLSTSDWITNQSTVDHKFYSYNTSALKHYSFANARNVFLVDNTGTLVYNSGVTIPDKDKVTIANTKQEMIKNKKVNTINDDYNPYSKSEYSNKYFNGDNNDWQYLQQGDIENHIDISQQVGGNKVEYSNLNETLGLYYIAKAAQQNKISQTIANNLAIYFINQSSLKGQISDKLTTTIVNLIINNQEIYNFLYNSPMQLTAKNYSLNWIFDKNNNLIEIYYNKWSNTNNAPNDKINYSFSDWYAGTSIATDNSNAYNILKWSDYARDWNTFANMYPTFAFSNSYFEASTSTGIKSSPTLSSNTAKIEQYKNPGNANVLFFAYINTKNGGSWGTEIALNLDLWHDNNNIYFQWYCFLNSSFGRNTYANIKLNNINFYNIMNN